MGRAVKETLFFERDISITGTYSIVGRNEKEGPLGSYFEQSIADALWGEKTFEQCERKLFKTAVDGAIKSSGMGQREMSFLLGGDLLNQIITAGYSARDIGLPFLGIYGACSTYAEGLILASVLAESGSAENSVAAASSHFAATERQFRFPLELGTPKTPTGQNTVTGAAAAVVSRGGRMPGCIRIEKATVGRVVDAGIKDAGNMGAAMAPAAVQTVLTHFENTNTTAKSYDAVITGDLGSLGAEIFREMTAKAGFPMLGRHFDCGEMIFHGCKNEYCGGSGCACGAVVLNSLFLKKLQNGSYKRILFAATGALLSPTSVMQKESIPGVAHAVELVNRVSCGSLHSAANFSSMRECSTYV